MPHIRFSIKVDTEDEAPSRVVRRIEGAVYRYAGESDVEEQIGNLCCFLVQPGLAEEKQVSLFDAMDSISDETAECYEWVFDPSTGGCRLARHRNPRPIHRVTLTRDWCVSVRNGHVPSSRR
jgi:hypothetical protein